VADVTIHIEPPPTHCSACGAEYRNIQHPLKPPGVIIQRLCDCKPVTSYQQVGPNHTIVEILANCDPNSRVIVHSGKYAFREAHNVTPGYYHREAENFDADIEGEAGTDSVLIEA
jgi:hypothetical protein